MSLAKSHSSMLSAGERYAKNGMQNIIDASSIASALPKRNNLVIQANKMKALALELLEEKHVQVTVPAIRNALDLLGIRMVHFVLEKPDPRLLLWNNLQEIGAALAQSIANLTGSEFPCPWICKKKRGAAAGPCNPGARGGAD